LKLGVKYTGLPFHLTVDGHVIGFKRILQYLRCREKNGDLVIDGWRFNPFYGRLYLSEREKWVNYLPPGPLGAVVDVGAGCGETAKFFLEHGASTVIAVENSEVCRPYLSENSERFGFDYILSAFDPETLMKLTFDTLKLDIEGWEIQLLPYLDRLNGVNIVLESHDAYITSRFLERGFKAVEVNDWNGGYIMRPRS